MSALFIMIKVTTKKSAKAAETISRKESAELGRLIGQFNAKVNRLSKINPEMSAYLPEKYNKANLLKHTATRKELLEARRDIKRFIDERGVTYVEVGQTKTTDWQRNIMNRTVDRVNAQRAKERERKNIAIEPGTMGKVKDVQLQPKTIPNFKKPANFKEWFRNLTKQGMSDFFNVEYENYKENMMKAIKKEFPEYASELNAIISQIPADTLQDMYWDNEDLVFGYIYSGNAALERVQNIIRTLSGYGYMDKNHHLFKEYMDNYAEYENYELEPEDY